jgi:hypothetical protein
LESAHNALELSLTQAVLFSDMPAPQASDARVPRRYRNESTAFPFQLVFKLPAKLKPTLIKNRLIQSSLSECSSDRITRVAGRGLRHGCYLQIFDAHHRVVLADGGRNLMQIITARVTDANKDALNSLSPFSNYC